MKILVGEDETLTRLDLCDMLEAAGHEVCATARDGAEAVELARSTLPDAALLDVKMSHVDGIEAARRILEERPFPIGIVSAYTERRLLERAAESGVFDYLAKPFRQEDLAPALATAVARFAELEAVRAKVATLADALAARKAIERAKGILMQRERLSEQEAFVRLRSARARGGRCG